MVGNTTWLLDIELKPAKKNCPQQDTGCYCATSKDVMEPLQWPKASLKFARFTKLGG